MSINNLQSSFINLSFASAANWGCYQAGVARYCQEHFEIINDERLLLSGSSSGALIAFLLLGEWDPVRMLVNFSQYYQNHHKILAGDAAPLASKYLKERIEQLTEKKKKDWLARCNDKLFVQISHRQLNLKLWSLPQVHFIGELKHGWATLEDVILDVEHSCSIPMFTSSAVGLVCEGSLPLDGAFSDWAPRLLQRIDIVPCQDKSNSEMFCWDQANRNGFMSNANVKKHNEEGASQFEEALVSSCETKFTHMKVPSKIIEPAMWRSDLPGKHLCVPINMHIEFVLDATQLGSKDASEHHKEFVSFGLREKL